MRWTNPRAGRGRGSTPTLSFILSPPIGSTRRRFGYSLSLIRTRRLDFSYQLALDAHISFIGGYGIRIDILYFQNIYLQTRYEIFYIDLIVKIDLFIEII